MFYIFLQSDTYEHGTRKEKYKKRTLTAHLGQNVGLGDGLVGNFLET